MSKEVCLVLKHEYQVTCINMVYCDIERRSTHVIMDRHSCGLYEKTSYVKSVEY